MTSANNRLNEVLEFVRIYNIAHKETPITQLEALKIYLKMIKTA